MKQNFALQTLFFVAIALSSHQQPDGPSPFDECRIVTAANLADAKAPTFASHRVAVPQVPGGAKLDLGSNPVARKYRTVMRQQLELGSNFAGHYRVAAWGCGSSCSMFAVLDINTGRVITPEGFSHTSGVFFGVDNGKLFPESQSDYGLFAFRKDSSLLVVLGDLDEDESREGAFYFVLDRERLKLVHTTAVKKNCERLRH
jgi:hypothetical protein